MFFCCDCCVLSGRGLCDELIARSEESYRLWCVVECDLKIPRVFFFYIRGSMHLDSILIRSNEQQPSASVAYRPRWRKIVALTL